MMKSEIRDPNLDPWARQRSIARTPRFVLFGIRVSDFGFLSDCGIRELGFQFK